MDKPSSYVYFAFYGDYFDPRNVTERLKVEPSQSWLKNELNSSGTTPRKFSFWQLSTKPDYEALDINRLVSKIITQLEEKIDIINQLKIDYALTTVLQVVLEIDSNPEISTPFLGHDSRTIAFLHNTQTTTDLDIYVYNSSNQ